MASNTIHLKGPYQLAEYRAADAITPGMLLEIDSNGEVIPHSTMGGRAQSLFAAEDALQGNTVDTDYSDDDLVACNIETPGNETEAWIAAGEDIDIGDELISEGTGMLIENGSETSGVTVEQVIATALEAIDLTGSGAVDTKIAVMVHP